MHFCASYKLEQRDGQHHEDAGVPLHAAPKLSPMHDVKRGRDLPVIRTCPRDDRTRVMTDTGAR